MDENTRVAMDLFFRDSEQKAYLTAMALTRNHHDALELVQESMLKMVQKYCDHDPQEWPPLFYRILHNGVKDWYRRQKFRHLLAGLMPWQQNELEQDPVNCKDTVENEALINDELTRVLQALQQLPLRQQQSFLMRAWQEMSTRETAFALSISENSVKTHYARALKKLRHLLGEYDE